MPFGPGVQDLQAVESRSVCEACNRAPRKSASAAKMRLRFKQSAATAARGADSVRHVTSCFAKPQQPEFRISGISANIDGSECLLSSSEDTRTAEMQQLAAESTLQDHIETAAVTSCCVANVASYSGARSYVAGSLKHRRDTQQETLLTERLDSLFFWECRLDFDS